MAESEPKNGGIYGILRTAIQERFLLQTNGTNGKYTLRRCGLSAVSTPSNINNPKWVENKPEKLGSKNSRHEVEKFVEFNGEITFQIRSKQQRYRQKTAFEARPSRIDARVQYPPVVI